MKLGVFCTALILSFQLLAQTTVSIVTQLDTALNSANAGSTIILKNGIWKDLNLSVSKGGSSTKPVTIKAETSEGVSFEGTFKASINASYVVLDGFTVKNLVAGMVQIKMASQWK
jgi:poly(beta-D-mannuronate) lyase